MACESGAFTGRDVVVYYAIGCPEAKPTADSYKRLGMMRGKTVSAEWDTADATGDMSPAFTQENLVTYKNVSFSGDGVTRKEDVFAQNALKRHVYNPPAETSNQPYVWLKIISPNDITEGPFMITSWSDEAPHDDVATWSIEGSSAGSVDVRDVGATITINTQPQGKTLTAGGTLSLSVGASVSDSSALAYQWKKGGSDISGATSATYTKTSVAESDSGSYTCQVSSPTAGAVTTSAASVTVSAAKISNKGRKPLPLRGLMKAITDIGQACIRVDGHEVFLNPSFLGMSRIGSAEEIVDAFVKVHGGKYPSHRMNSGPVSKMVYAACFAEMTEAAARVVQACSEQDVTRIIGQYRVTTSGRLLYRPGAIPMDDVITIARHLMNHGVMGDQPAEEAQRRDGDYSDRFEPRSFVYTAVAHLGMSESDAWNMTMTSFRAAMDAKFPQKAKVKIPSQERYDEAMDWAEKMMAIDANRHGPH